jgi:hypothetical protein
LPVSWLRIIMLLWLAAEALLPGSALADEAEESAARPPTRRIHRGVIHDPVTKR